jgi:hypothetical protein
MGKKKRILAEKVGSWPRKSQLWLVRFGFDQTCKF